MRRVVGLIVAALFAVVAVLAKDGVYEHERLLSFEGEGDLVDFTTTASSIAISDQYFKEGDSSLMWDYESGGQLNLKRDLGFEAKDPAVHTLQLSTFIVWIYNSEPKAGSVEFQFLKEGELCTSFPFYLNFKGWRAAWVVYERDMEGTPVEGMDEVVIKAPEGESGRLYIDHLLTSARTDARHQTADEQVPFVNAETTNHWQVVYNKSLLEPREALMDVSERDREEFATLAKRFEELIYTPTPFSVGSMESIRESYESYNLRRNSDGEVVGLPIFFVRAASAYENLSADGVWDKQYHLRRGMGLKSYYDFMGRVVVNYRNALAALEDKTMGEAQRAEVEVSVEELREMFVMMYEHITNQGVSYGSGWGNISHYGYSIKNLYNSYFLMRDILREQGRLEEAERTMRWYSIVNDVYPESEKPGLNIDVFNTAIMGRISSILMMEDTPEKLRYMRAFSKWLNNGCLPALGLEGSFKEDGAVFHHCNNYPAYAIGGMNGATSMVYLLSRTSFALSSEAHNAVRRSLLTMEFYCNTYHFPLSMSGRHPDGEGTLVPLHFATMAIAGSPDATQEFDAQMGAAYMRLYESSKLEHEVFGGLPRFDSARERYLIDQFVAMGVEAEDIPQGNRAINYGCTSIQRRDQWSVVMRGHSRYLWAAEHYVGANLYGRYLAHGSMQVMTSLSPEHLVTPLSSGWVEDGFDWGRIPGATAIHLPIPDLKANVMNVDAFSGEEEMLYSDEAFAGALSQSGRDGNFAMKLHEHDKYNGSHRARKSYHIFDNMVVALGSGIENIVEEHPTETTLLQLAMVDEQQRAHWQSQDPSRGYVVDCNGTGYYIPKSQRSKILFERNRDQISYDEESGAENSGDWALLTLNHGTAPKGESYEYAVVVGSSESQMKSFAKSPEYRVLQASDDAHIVECRRSGQTSYALFERCEKIDGGAIIAADTSCLAMTKVESKSRVLLSVCQPDLALYRGESDEAFNERGERVERSIYSRPWIGNDSGMIPVTLTLKGEWRDTQGREEVTVTAGGGTTTTVVVECRGGVTYDIELERCR